MDLDEWEYLPDEGFLEIHDDGGGNKIFSRKNHWKIDPNIMFKDYFKKPQFVDSTEEKSNFPNQIVPIPIQFHPPNHQKQIIEIPAPIRTEPIKIKSPEPEPVKIESPKAEPIKIESAKVEPVKIESLETERESVSQVFFKKTKETHEFVDMKMDSPKSGNRVIVGESMEVKSKKNLEGDLKGEKEVVIWRESSSSNEGLNIWKWGLSGIGAICSFGVVAATVCIIILGTGNKQSHQHKISFHVYHDDNKRISEVVNTSKYNEAISAAKGVPLTRARIAFGGYIDAL